MNVMDDDCVTKVRTLTQQLLDCARAEAWEEAVDIEALRRPLLYEVFGHVREGTHIHHRKLLNEILEADREIMALAQQRRAELADLLRQTSQGRVAMKAYGANGP